jgi:aminomethyltransferase
MRLTDADVLKTPLHALHLELGARMTPFAGYDMPLQYPAGILKEHLHTRAAAGLFDVSHMGQVILRPRSGDVADAARALERLVPVDILGLAMGRQRYALFTNAQGGIMDDLMVANRGDHLFVVVNAACKEADEAHMRLTLSDAVNIERLADRALLALQGPAAEAALASLAPEVAAMKFMDVMGTKILGADCIVSRSGYSGEDGYEISVPEGDAEALARALLAIDTVEPIGLGARDSLRLEAGLCLYGSDLDTTTSPVEASLVWAMQKARRPGGEREGGFPGASRILAELAEGPARKRVGLLPEGRAPVRGGTELFAAENSADVVGTVTSGAFGPSLGGPMAMGYVLSAHAATGTRLFAEVRGKKLPVTVADMPFVKPNYKRG